jgi:hypothetical protein
MGHACHLLIASPRRHGIAILYGELEVSEAKRLRALKAENAKVKRLLADAMLDNTKKGDAHCPFPLGYRSPREYILSRPAACPL